MNDWTLWNESSTDGQTDGRLFQDNRGARPQVVRSQFSPACRNEAQ